MRTPLVIVALAVCAAAHAGVYKWTDANGEVHYGDRPVQDAQVVHVPGDAPAAASSPSPTAPQSGGSGVGEGTYSQFEIVQPTPDATLRSAQGEVEIAVVIQPALQPGQHLRISVDGQALDGRFNSPRVVLRHVGLGSHTVQAAVVDDQDQEVATTAPVSFHMRRPADRKPAP